MSPHLDRLAPQKGYGHCVGIEDISADSQLNTYSPICKVIDSTSQRSHPKQMGRDFSRDVAK
jgi:hypothetical protein